MLEEELLAPLQGRVIMPPKAQVPPSSKRIANDRSAFLEVIHLAHVTKQHPIPTLATHYQLIQEEVVVLAARAHKAREQESVRRTTRIQYAYQEVRPHCHVTKLQQTLTQEILWGQM